MVFQDEKSDQPKNTKCSSLIGAENFKWGLWTQAVDLEITSWGSYEK